MNVSTGSATVEGLWEPEEPPKKVIFCIPTITKPYQVTLDSLAASIPLITAAGWEEGAVYEVGNPYISVARSLMLRKALDAKATVIVFIDHDLSWEPEDLLRLIEAEGDVVSGTYRYKREPEEYMGRLFPGLDGCPIVREDGCLKSYCIPAGFMKITRRGVNRFIERYPELCYGERCSPHVDLFNHGAHKHVWFGEDYAFSRNWTDMGGEIWLIPDLHINHHTTETGYAGDFKAYLMARSE